MHSTDDRFGVSNNGIVVGMMLSGAPSRPGTFLVHIFSLDI